MAAVPVLERDRFPKNAPGDFYTTGARLPDGTWCGDCLSCGVPEDVAATLLSPLTDEDCDTYFVRQPVTAGDIDQACEACDSCCVDALRYGGRDPRILAKLPQRLCDYPKPGPLRALLHRLFSRNSAS